MLIKRTYYTLKEKKFLTDGNFIPECKKLLYICTENEKAQLMYTPDQGDIMVFWEKEENLNFVCEVEEEWSELELRVFIQIVKSSN